MSFKPFCQTVSLQDFITYNIIAVIFCIAISYQYQNVKTRSCCIWWNWVIGLLSFWYISAQFCLPKCHKDIPKWPHRRNKPLGPMSRLQMKSLGHFGGIFQHFWQQEPVLCDHYYSFCFIYQMSNQVSIEKSWNCNGNLHWRFVPYYWVLWKPVSKSFEKSFTKCQSRLSLL